MNLYIYIYIHIYVYVTSNTQQNAIQYKWRSVTSMAAFALSHIRSSFGSSFSLPLSRIRWPAWSSRCPHESTSCLFDWPP